MGALIIRIRSWGPFYYNYNKDPPHNNIGNYFGSYIESLAATVAPVMQSLHCTQAKTAQQAQHFLWCTSSRTTHSWRSLDFRTLKEGEVPVEHCRRSVGGDACHLCLHQRFVTFVPFHIHSVTLLRAWHKPLRRTEHEKVVGPS